ncbi:hypothetical protein DAPPUDRAFT_276769 [Daphnia pulex]|uniref:ARHGEF1-like PH domain-containing protein n=1 Tax=Daphnia pulex TaxID=6669 RepID=E9I617_DAPPU|nr:hypothetical protein DAPPUDRAFT_276769 [Daphnia pulex]|eukprot:EFX60563.1 hypothetical protein DAPPUDRAFT_276769 [Daphnia pulex]
MKPHSYPVPSFRFILPVISLRDLSSISSVSFPLHRVFFLISFCFRDFLSPVYIYIYDTRSIYLISSNPDEPEMYELQCQIPREKRIWIDTIRAAVEQCPEDEEGNVSEGEEQRKIREVQQTATTTTGFLHGRPRLRPSCS